MRWRFGVQALRDAEFLHVDDAADALVFLMTHYSSENHVNVGSGTDLTIFELVKTIADVVNFKGEIKKDTEQTRWYAPQIDGRRSIASHGLEA